MKYFINDQTDFSAHKQIVLDNLERIDFRDLTCVIDASLRMFADEVTSSIGFDGEKFTVNTCNVLDETNDMDLCSGDLEECIAQYIGGYKDNNDKVINALKELVERVEDYAIKRKRKASSKAV